MPTVKITVSNPQKKTAIQREFEEPQAIFLGKKIGDKVQADSIGLAGIELEITGGSDKEGFPMRRDIEGQGRKRVLLSGPPGYNPDREGKRKRKSVRGNTVSADIVQINTKIMKHGAKSAEELWGVTPKKKESAEKKEAKPEKPAASAAMPEEKKPEHKEEHKPEKKEEHKPAAEKAEAKMGVKKVE